MPARRRSRSKHALIRASEIVQAIRFVRGHKVMFDTDLALLYGVATKVLVQAVKRNLLRFPPDFMFQLTPREFSILRSQTVTSRSWGGRRTPPYVFTEQGVAMLASVLRSTRAIQANIEIVRAFVRLRAFLESHEALARRVAALQRKYDAQFGAVFEAIREMRPAAATPRRRIGFGPGVSGRS